MSKFTKVANRVAIAFLVVSLPRSILLASLLTFGWRWAFHLVLAVAAVLILWAEFNRWLRRSQIRTSVVVVGRTAGIHTHPTSKEN